METLTIRAVRAMAEAIVLREGGFNNIPEDRGGATNHGVSLRYLKGLGLRGDLDGDGDVDEDDIRLVTPDKAVDLYLEDFYYEPKFNKLPEVIQEQLFDMAVNHGANGAVRMLQTTVNLYRTGTDLPLLVVDGIMGKRTLLASEEAALDFQEEGLNFNDALAETRIVEYKQIVARDPSQSKFLRGWLFRAAEFHSRGRKVINEV